MAVSRKSLRDLPTKPMMERPPRLTWLASAPIGVWPVARMTMLRLSVGLEDKEDIITDLKQALTAP